MRYSLESDERSAEETARRQRVWPKREDGNVLRSDVRVKQLEWTNRASQGLCWERSDVGM